MTRPARSDAREVLTTSASGRIIGGHEIPGAGPGPEVMAASSLQRNRVLNLEGEPLGRLREIMIDVRDGRVAYAVLSRGGVCGFGERLHAVPWRLLALDARARCFRLDLSVAALDALDGFDRASWPMTADHLGFAQAGRARH